MSMVLLQMDSIIGYKNSKTEILFHESIIFYLKA